MLKYRITILLAFGGLVSRGWTKNVSEYEDSSASFVSVFSSPNLPNLQERRHFQSLH